MTNEEEDTNYERSYSKFTNNGNAIVVKEEPAPAEDYHFDSYNYEREAVMFVVSALKVKEEIDDNLSNGVRFDHNYALTANASVKDEIDFEEHKPELTVPVPSLSSGSEGDEDIEDRIPRYELMRSNKTETSSAPAPKLTTNGSPNKSNLEYHCTHCPYTAREIQLMGHHDHSQNSCTERYRCNQCPYKTRYGEQYRRHLLSHGLVVVRHSKVYKCNDCSYATTVRNSFSHHYIVKHSRHPAPIYRCDYCPLETKHRNNLNEHYLVKHAEHAHVYKCDYCSYETKRRGCITQHYKNRHSIHAPIYQCEDCVYETGKRSHLIQHYKNIHSKVVKVQTLRY